MPTDEDYAAFGMMVLFLALLCFLGIYSAINKDDQKQRLEAYQNQLNTYVLCVQKAQDKSICGKLPNLKDYL